MTQANTNVILYSQAVAKLQSLSQAFISGTLKSPQDIARSLQTILSSYEHSAGQPLFDFMPVSVGEPPLSSVINKLFSEIQFDVGILQQQIDVLAAAAAYTHNIYTTQLLQIKQQNSALSNDVDTLELYSTNASSGNLISFSNSFGNSGAFDLAKSSAPPALVHNGILTLPQVGPLANLSNGTVATILSTSNGVAGNNQEIEDPSLAPMNPTTKQPIYNFVSDIYNPSKVNNFLDGNPTTWFEYESYLISSQDQASAGNYNFTYAVPNTSSTQASHSFNWANGPGAGFGGVSTGVLNLNMQVDLGTVQPANYITYTPYGVDNNLNNPVLITSISTSTDGATWVPLDPSSMWIGTNSSLSTLNNVSSNVSLTIGTAVWSFEVRQIRYVAISIEQPAPIDVNIGHLYYYGSNGVRDEGPVPSLSNPSEYNSGPYTSGEGVEYFVGKRWAIGITDFVVQQVAYESFASIVTQPLNVGAVINEVALDADVWVPPDFNVNTQWVDFYVSPDDGQTWYPITYIQNDASNTPEVLSFNTTVPVQFQNPRISYINVKAPVTSLRLKIELNSPNTIETPIVRSYTLKVTTQ